MMDDINILKLASAMARHAVARHQVISENLANADTPNFKAKDIEAFTQAYERFSRKDVAAPEMGAGKGPAAWRFDTVSAPGVESPNGNNVSIEDQMMRSIEAQQDHQAATAIYRKAMNIMRLTLGRNA
ncbi:MAG: FlgB family protein [Hyphococcus sp.]